MPKGVALYVVPGDVHIEEAVADIRFFLAGVEGMSGDAAERAVLPFPSHEIDPYRGLMPHVGVTATRARVLHALATGSTRVVVASAAALLPRVSAQAGCSPLRSSSPGNDIALRSRRAARRRGVQPRGSGGRARRVRGPGRNRGHLPCRRTGAGAARFVGDTIETLRAIRRHSGRSPVDQVMVIPPGTSSRRERPIGSKARAAARRIRIARRTSSTISRAPGSRG